MPYRDDARRDPEAARGRLEAARARVEDAERLCAASAASLEGARAEIREEDRALARDVALLEHARRRAVHRRLASATRAPSAAPEVEAQLRESLRSEAVVGALDRAHAGVLEASSSAGAGPELDVEDASGRLREARRARAVAAATAHERILVLESALAEAEEKLRTSMHELEAAEASHR